MKITVTKTGTIVGVHEELGPIDTTALPGDLGPRIEAKVAEIGFFELPAQLGETQQIADAANWEIRIVDGDREHAVSFGDGSDPTEAKPLADLLRLIEESGVEFHDAPWSAETP